MDIGWYTQIALNGFMAGMLYVVIALGFSMVYGVMRIVNFAHGHLYMLGGLFMYGITATFGLDFFVSLLISAVAVGLVGMVLEKAVFAPLKNLESPSVIAGIGAAIFIGGIADIITAGETRRVEAPWHGSIQIGDIFLPSHRLIISGIALAAVLTFWAFLRYTKFGRATRATVDDSEIAAAYGIDIRRVYAVNFALAAALAGLAGALVAPITGASPDVALPAMFKAFIVVILGGLGSVPGAVLGGLILGFLDSTITTLISSAMAQMLSFLVVLIVLVIRPVGLLGRT
ncbi:MAG: branched-chain amino acid ABC transporter permease [Dehalococcoidia bacterium]|nr:branched-chain amino acid ABC transporter permease [Dehalococcoidia bacterium]